MWQKAVRALADPLRTDADLDGLVARIGDARLERERRGNYVPSTLGDRCDALLWFGDTTALQPLRTEPGDDPEPETSPSGV